MRLYKENVPVLGTSPVSIDRAENRHKFSEMLDNLTVDQPRWKELSSIDDIYEFVDRIGFPVLVRPSYVLSGAAMNVVSNKNELTHFLELAARYQNSILLLYLNSLRMQRRLRLMQLQEKEK